MFFLLVHFLLLLLCHLLAVYRDSEKWCQWCCCSLEMLLLYAVAIIGAPHLFGLPRFAVCTVAGFGLRFNGWFVVCFDAI